MPSSPSSRFLVTQILTTILIEHRPLNQILNEKLTPSKDRGFIQELCYGVMRWYWQLDAILLQLLSKPLKDKDIDIHVLLLSGFYQLIHLQTPAHAALHESVQTARELKKPWATGLINGVLRQFLREKNIILEKINNIPAAHYSHPKWLLKTLEKSWPDQCKDILQANNQRPPMTLRVNRLQNSREEYLQLLQHNQIEAQFALETENGIILNSPCDVAMLPGFNKGSVSVQDSAPQLAAKLLDLKPGQRVLDACAAPGGKTAHILETEPELKQLIAVDVDEKRCEKIRENLHRLGLESAEFPDPPPPTSPKRGRRK